MNLLFLMVDEMSHWVLTNPDIKTPNLDKLAARGRRFDAAYTPSPICVPARAAVACGKDVHDIGYWSSAQAYDGGVPSWGHGLQNAGLEPVSIGKLHYRSVEDDCGFSRQIEPIHVVNGIGWVTALMRKPTPTNTTSDSLARDIGPGETDYIAFDRRVTKAAVRWIEDQPTEGTDWCAFVSWLAPHFPLVAPPEDYALYDAASLRAEAQPVPDHPIVKEIERYFDHDRHFTPESRGVAKASYFGLCTFIDRQVGKVLDALEGSGLSDETLVIFTSDHGEMLGEKGCWTKSTMYESSVRVPLVLAGPKVPNTPWEHPVSLIDCAPTICAALGATGDFSGVDLRAPVAERHVLSEYHDGGSVVGVTMLRWAHWKLVHYAEGFPPQLFDLQADPEEHTDLSQSRADVLAEGLAHLAARMDPEAVNTEAFAAQARRVAELGGRDVVLAIPTFDYTPADSR